MISYIGRVKKYKNLELIVDALEKIREKFPRPNSIVEKIKLSLDPEYAEMKLTQ